MDRQGPREDLCELFERNSLSNLNHADAVAMVNLEQNFLLLIFDENMMSTTKTEKG
jgi:hypothetical protein